MAGLLLLPFAAPNVPTVPTVPLLQGVLPGAKVMMPVIAAGTGGYKGSNATDAVRRAFTMGFNHVHTAFDYFNLKEIGVALKEVPRAQYFLSGMTSPCSHPAAPPQRNVTDPKACRNLTMHEARSVMNDLGVDSLDLLMLHGPSEGFGHVGPCSKLACELNRAQWSAYKALLQQGSVRAIGVSNFCASCLACLDDVPAVNQIQVHVGQGSADPGPGLLSYCASRGVVVQAYEPLAGGELVTDPACHSIGAAHQKTAAQVALRWVLQRAPSLAVRAGSSAHLAQDLALFDFTLNSSELARLDAQKGPSGEAGGRCSWGCTE